MRRRLLMLAGLLSAGVMAQDGAPAPDGAAELAARMDRASHTEGFRLRAQLEREDGGEALRVFMAGEKGPSHQRLLLRATAPDALRGQGLVLEALSGQPLRAVHFGAAGGKAQAADALQPFLGTGLVPWDFSGQWWHWPQQARGADESCLTQRCQVLDSSGALRGGVARVRSWYAPQLQLTMRLAFHAADGKRLRELRVTSFFRRADGSAGARALSLTDASGAVWRMTIYNGEEGVALAPDTFAIPP